MSDQFDLLAKLTARVTELSDEVTELRQRVEGGSAQLVEDEGSEDGEEWSPRSWSQRHREDEHLGLLMDWVDQMLREHVPLPAQETIPTCWPAHTTAISQFAALHSAWVAAVSEDEEKDESTNAVAAFYQYYWHAGLARLHTALQGCTTMRHERDDAPPLTRRELATTTMGTQV